MKDDSGLNLYDALTLSLILLAVTAMVYFPGPRCAP